jgi:DNA helicase-2/ATP-dependent DNA helicase PcrA
VYSQRKRQLGVVDYADMVSQCHRLLDQYPAIAERVRLRYRAVLLDEYQDTNPAQRELLRRIFGPGFPVTAVGDADQTIYEWRGASLDNFRRFPEHFPNADGTPSATLQLSRNRRSAHRIVELANLVRNRIEERGGLDRLRALDEAPEGSIATGWFHSALDEARGIAEEICRLHEEEAVAWREMGVLFRRHSHISLVRDALEKRGVPVEVASLGGLLDVPEVADLHAWLRLIGRPDDATALVRVLLGAHYRLGLGDLAPLAAWTRARRGDDNETDEAAGWAMIEAVDHLEECSGLSDEAASRLRRFGKVYAELLTIAQSANLVELCRRILDRTGAWPEVEALDDAARLSARLNLYRFLDLAEQWSPLEGASSLDAFLDYLDLLTEDTAGDELDTARLGGEDAVALLTVHRAKGLEWKVVLLPAVCETVFPSRARTYEDPVALARFLPYERRLDVASLPSLPADEKARRAVLQKQHADEEWRIAYVAVTRAKERLVCTGAFWYTEKRHKEPSALFALASGMDAAECICAEAEPGEPPPVHRLESGVPAPDPCFSKGWRQALRNAVADPELPRRIAEEHNLTPSFNKALHRLNTVLGGLPEQGPALPRHPAFHTSVTGLVTYARCPRRFHWSEIDHLPRRPSAGLRRGTELHRRIELHNRGTMPLEEAGLGFYDLPAETGTKPKRGGFGDFVKSRFAAVRPLLVEAPFELRVNSALIAGRIDAVYEPEPGLWEIVDFKSGSPRHDPADRVQLEAYAIAVQDAGFSTEPPRRTRVTFAFFGNGLTEHTEDVDDVWLAEAREHLSDLVAGASGTDHAPTPSAACRHCDFSRFCPEGKAWLADQV